MEEIKGCSISQILAGIPVNVPECNIAITQPRVKDICAFGEDRFFQAVAIITQAESFAEKIKAGNKGLEFLSDFQILMVIFDQEASVKQQAVDLFEMIFPKYIVQFDAGSINFRYEEEGKIVGQLNPMNFESFKRTIGQLFIPSSLMGETEPEYNPANEKAAEIAAKLKKGREKVKQLNSKQEEGAEIFGPFASVLAIGLGMDINIFFNYTPFQLFDAFIRFNKKRSYDFYQRVSTMPLMDVSKIDEPEDWSDTKY